MAPHEAAATDQPPQHLPIRDDDKTSRYQRLVECRKMCQKCAGLENPATVDGGRLDSDHIGPYSRWQGSLDAELVVVGKDFAPVAKFRHYEGLPGSDVMTNRRLREFLREAGFDIAGTRSGCSHRGVFLTNAVLCLPGGASMRTTVRRQDLRTCGTAFLRPTIELIAPRAVATLGEGAWGALAHAFALDSPPFAEAVEVANGIELPSGPRAFPMYHPVASRRKDGQLADWRRLGEWLRARDQPSAA